MTRRAPSGSCYILGPYSSHTNCRQNIMDEKWGLNGFDMKSSAIEIVFLNFGSRLVSTSYKSAPPIQSNSPQKRPDGLC